MADLSTLYELCLERVCHFLRDGIWSEKFNPFRLLPKGIIEDLISTSLKFQQLNGFKADDLKLLLTSNKIRHFKLDLKSILHLNFWNPERWRRKNIEIERELCQALHFLTSASNHLETLELLNADFYHESPQLTETLNKLLKNSPNLKHLHSKVKFDLKALRNCKRLQKIMVHFKPRQPWCDFLEDQASLKPLDSIEIFVIRDRKYDISSVESKYVEILLRHCSSLTSLGTLAKLYRTSFPSQVKLRVCEWGEFKSECTNERAHFVPENIRSAVTYNSFVEELNFPLNSIHSICYLRQVKNLFHLELWVYVKGDFCKEFGSALKEIGAQLKYLLLWFLHPTDVSSLLKNCPNLQALDIVGRYSEFSESALRLPNLKVLSFTGSDEAKGRFLSLLSDCNHLEAVFFIGLDEENFGKFLKRNSLSNLKTVYFEEWDLSKQIFKEFLLNASNLEKIQVATFNDEEMENELKNILLETNHKASFNGWLVTKEDEFFITYILAVFQKLDKKINIYLPKDKHL